MRATGHLEKWASGVLGAVCLILTMLLVLQFTGVRAGGSRPTMPSATSAGMRRPQTVSPGGPEELARYDALVRLDLLKEFQTRPVPQLPRNPFEFEPLETPVRQAEPAAAPPAAPPPAGPTPVPLKALGYSENPGGVRQAFISDGDQVYVVQEGESFAKRFRVVKISPTLVEIEDESSRQTVRLPITQ